MGDLRVEKYFPLFLFFLALVLMVKFSSFSIFHYLYFTDILSATLNIGAITTGFISTILAVTMGLPNTTLEKLRESKYINELVWYIFEAIIASLLVVVISVVGFFMSSETLKVIFSSMWVSVLIYGLANIVRMTFLMMVLIKADPDSL